MRLAASMVALLAVVITVAVGAGVAPRAGDGNAASAATEGWQTLARSAVPRTEAAAARIGDRLYVAGGVRGGAALRTLESYNPRTRRWRAEPRLKTPRHGLGAVAHRGRIVVFEGGPRPGLTYSDTTEALRIDG